MADSQKHEKPNVDLRRIDLIIHVEEGREVQNSWANRHEANSEKHDPWDLSVFSKDSATMDVREHLRETMAKLVNSKFVSHLKGDINNNSKKSKWKYNFASKSFVLKNPDDVHKRRSPVRSISVRPADKSAHLLDKKQLHKLRSWVPKRFKFHRPTTLFSTTKDGFHLQTMYHMCRNYSEFALIIRTDKDERFGAFIKCLETFEDSRKVRGYCGTGETFVFSFAPVPVRYPWVGQTQQKTRPSQNMFISAANNSLIIGGGDGYAIQLGSDLERGYTGMCDTFYNPILCQDVHFRCLELEVLGFRS
ncbi:PREDICTED: TLD domain-containing protein 2-like [Branchiostoma belcheri]|uniref:TLD domain-containing protein 2-like n=1 Tax=Branchiostoma belcheri TaxID=7741 RepID=A0A6P4ZZU4_BRABE|nr:PREDICTED: TLD domain-containing protein 2-like [Branchiostoma belcheri]XP_019646621.1 PREDICTED: TLD domain-containing protein 2-like [Branchiostoma belcheri]